MQVNEYKPLIVAFCCNWCSYAGADLAGNNRLNDTTSIIRMSTLQEFYRTNNLVTPPNKL